MEKADNDLCAAFKLGSCNSNAMERYKTDIQQTEAFGFLYKTAGNLAKSSIEEMIDHFTLLAEKLLPKQINMSLLGAFNVPNTSLQQAEELYFSDIAPQTVTGKSQGQKEHWLKEQRVTIQLFIA